MSIFHFHQRICTS